MLGCGGEFVTDKGKGGKPQMGDFLTEAEGSGEVMGGKFNPQE